VPQALTANSVTAAQAASRFFEFVTAQVACAKGSTFAWSALTVASLAASSFFT